jgi:tRNA (cytidine/uridine-2'-O-)-methyltransferase
MRIALYEPEIAGNVGAVLRLGACLGVPVDLIEPMGFGWDDKRVRRTAMDYIDHVAVTRHQGFAAFRETAGDGRLVLLTTKADRSLYEAMFEPTDILLFGRESAGVPAEVAAACDLKLKIPTVPGVRSLNLAMAAGIAASEALRQLRPSPISA